MSTRSTIALELADGTVKQIYCHSDGYLSYNGCMLLDHYSDPAKVGELMALGDISMLGIDIGEQINFNDRLSYKNGQAIQCRAYGRDRGETGIDARYFWNFEMYSMTHQREEYAYILRNDGRWCVAIGEGVFVDLLGAMGQPAQHPLHSAFNA